MGVSLSFPQSGEETMAHPASLARLQM